MDSAVELIGPKTHVQSNAWLISPSALTSFESDPGVVVDLFFAVDDRRTKSSVAHDLGVAVDEIPVRIREDHAEIVQSVRRGEPVIDFDQGPRIRSGGGEA